ncbi:glutamic acid-rich protein-like [Chenopodium quinoa]|uniref:glutamic acid-rich protein-like n=1 Tax=Chenopodium quinoa TaxID=63459 RepID=UPI000B781737|nr:glutamic acid-rich protein-like [Chenopodium quinoa]
MLDAERINCIKDRNKKQKANLSASDSQLFSETQKLIEDPKVQRAIGEIEEQHKNPETNPDYDGDNQDGADATSNFIHDDINLDDENEESEKEEEKEEEKNEEEKDENKEEKEENKEEKEEDEKEKEKDEKQQEKEAEVSVGVEANTANQPVDGDDIDEEPNEDLNNIVSSVTESDGDKQPVVEETIVLKNIHQEIASKININVDLEKKMLKLISFQSR